MDEQEQQNEVNEGQQDIGQVEPPPLSPPPSKIKLIIGVVVVFVLVAVGIAGAYFLFQPKAQPVDYFPPPIPTAGDTESLFPPDEVEPENVMRDADINNNLSLTCTDKMFECPNGRSVQAQGPKCQQAQCPLDYFPTNTNPEHVLIDLGSFEILGGCFSKDVNNVYCTFTDNMPAWTSTVVIQDADSTTFKVFPDDVYASFAVDKNHVYLSMDIIEGADPETFQPIGNVYSKDKNNVYHRDDIITGIDPETFEYLDNSFVKDKNYVYRAGRVVSGVYDVATFEVITEYFKKDKDFIYYFYYEDYVFKVLEGADPNTFEVLERGYSKDKNLVYYNVTTVVGADPNTLELYPYNSSASYAKDKDSVYRAGEIVSGADTATFKFLTYGYSKDKNNIYYNGIAITEADTATFKVLGWDSGGYAVDKNNVYKNEEIVIGADPSTYFIP